jgi:Arc/MetJ family transcription regulator
MVGRPKIETDAALAADVQRRMDLHGLSIRRLGVELNIPRSSAHRLARQGVISGERRASVLSWLEAIDRAGASAIRKPPARNQGELMGQILKTSQELVTLISELDAMMRRTQQ